MRFAVVGFALSISFCLYGQVPTKDRTVIVISLDGFPASALQDPTTPVPTLRTLMRGGSYAMRMTTVNPTVTWPNHTAMVTGVYPPRHGVFFNGTLVRGESGLPVKVDPSVLKEKMVHVPTVYDLAYQAGLTTAQVDWVAIEHAPTITWEFPEVPSTNGSSEREMVRLGIVRPDEIEQFRTLNIVRRDQISTDAAIQILRKHTPNLLLFHLLTLDSTQHAYGPGSLAAKAAMGFLDSCVARVVDAAADLGADKRATILVVSDHGFKPVTHQIHTEAALVAAGIREGVQIVPEGGTAMVYFDRAHKAKLLGNVTQTLGKIEGVVRVVGRDGFAALHLPDPEKERQAPDLLLVAKAGYSFAGGATRPIVVTTAQPTGSHGYLNDDPDLDAIFIANGFGLRSGVSLDRVRNIDIAPTIASLLGLTLNGIDGRPMKELLE